MSSRIIIVTVVAVIALTSRIADSASLRDIARDVKSDRVLLDAVLGVSAVPQSRNHQKVDLSRLDVPTGNFVCF